MYQQRIRGCRCIERFAKPAERQCASVFGIIRRNQQIDVAHQVEMLKAIIEHMDRAAEPCFGQSPCHVSARRHEHRSARHFAGQHLRLIAGVVHIHMQARAIAHDDHAFVHDFSRVSAAENRRALSHIDQHAREFTSERRLAAAADRQIADADDRRRETMPEMRPVLVVAPAGACELAVKKIQHID